MKSIIRTTKFFPHLYPKLSSYSRQRLECNIREITEILMNILTSFFVQHLIFILAAFIKSLMKYLLNFVILSEQSLINSQNLLQKQLHFSFFSWKNRICHHKFKLEARNNGLTKKEAKICIRICMISRILHQLDRNRQLWPKDIYYATNHIVFCALVTLVNGPACVRFLAKNCNAITSRKSFALNCAQ